MPLPRKQFVSRRWRSLLLLVIGSAMVGWWIWWLESTLARTSYATGYAMFGVILFLAGYNVRKRLPGLPLGSSATWMQLHLYLGFGSVALFAWHTGFPLSKSWPGTWPNGWLESTLAATYLATFGSGIWGLYLTRTIPRQLARTADQVIYERIPQLRHSLNTHCRTEVMTAVAQTGSMTLADFYTNRIDSYLASPRSLLYALRPNSGLRRALMRELNDLKRFLSDPEQLASEKIFATVRKKDDLDFHEARQGLLKRWLFVHITLTWLLISFATLHGIIALSMQGGAG